MKKYFKIGLPLLIFIIISILAVFNITHPNVQIPSRYYIQYLSQASRSPNSSNQLPPKNLNTSYVEFKDKQGNQTNGVPDLWENYRDKWVASTALVKIRAPKQIILDSNYQLAMQNKGYHPLVRLNERFRARHDRFYKYCSIFDTRNGNELSLDIGYYAGLFNDNYELLQCVTNKVASTQWVRIFILLNGENPEDYFNRKLPLGDDDLLWKKIALDFNLNNDTVTSKRFQTYTKIIFVRHPFAKILSAYNDKFTKSRWYIEEYAPQIIQVNYLIGFATNENEFYSLNQTKKYGLTKQREEFILKQIGRLKPNDLSEYRITFHEFLVYLVSFLPNNRRLEMDKHWGVISLYCNPCSVIYDVIAKYETLFEDTSDILEYLFSKSHIRVDEIVKANVQTYATTEKCNNEFRAIPLWLKKQLYMLYREDFLMFGYPYDESLLQDNACRI